MTEARVKVYIGLGSNLADPVRQIWAGFDALARLPDTKVDRRSSLYRSAPLGGVTQPDFVNAVCRLITILSAETLLQRLLDIERIRGRVRRGPKGGPRILDLDLLLYGQRIFRGRDLVLPHPRLHERAFVLYPLLEIDPDLTVPGLGPAKDLAARCAGQVIESMPRTKENHETVSE